MRRLELLIEEARELSQNESYNDDSGISQRVFNRYFKNAQDAMQKGLANAKTKILLKTQDPLTTIVSQQAFYPYPDDLYINNIDTLEWSQNGINSFIPMSKAITKERITNSKAGYPFSYILKDTGVILNPPIQSGFLRWNYIKKLPTLEKRSGRISAVTIVGGQITALTLDINESSYDPTYINKQNTLCVVDRTGLRLVKNIEYTSIDPATGIITLEAPPVDTMNALISVNQIPTGAVNNSNTVFTLPYLPDDPTALVFTIDGLEQTPGIDYTLNGIILTTLITPPLAPGQVPKVRYSGRAFSSQAVTVGDYITVGEDTYNKADLPGIAESYLVKHAVYEAKYGDSSQWTQAAVQDMSMNLQTLIESFAKNSDDIDEIPITNSDYLMIW